MGCPAVSFCLIFSPVLWRISHFGFQAFRAPGRRPPAHVRPTFVPYSSYPIEAPRHFSLCLTPHTGCSFSKLSVSFRSKYTSSSAPDWRHGRGSKPPISASCPHRNPSGVFRSRVNGVRVPSNIMSRMYCRFLRHFLIKLSTRIRRSCVVHPFLSIKPPSASPLNEVQGQTAKGSGFSGWVAISPLGPGNVVYSPAVACIGVTLAPDLSLSR